MKHNRDAVDPAVSGDSYLQVVIKVGCRGWSSVSEPLRVHSIKSWSLSLVPSSSGSPQFTLICTIDSDFEAGNGSSGIRANLSSRSGL
jgi:hypothetical protein